MILQTTSVLYSWRMSGCLIEMTKARFDKMTMALGFNANRLGLLNDTLLRSAFNVLEVMTYDWVHTTLQDGSISVDTYHLIEACAAINISVKDREAFLKGDLASPEAAASSSSRYGSSSPPIGGVPLDSSSR